jgi:hypothetical protein
VSDGAVVGAVDEATQAPPRVRTPAGSGADWGRLDWAPAGTSDQHNSAGRLMAAPACCTSGCIPPRRIVGCSSRRTGSAARGIGRSAGTTASRSSRTKSHSSTPHPSSRSRTPHFARWSRAGGRRCRRRRPSTRGCPGRSGSCSRSWRSTGGGRSRRTPSACWPGICRSLAGRSCRRCTGRRGSIGTRRRRHHRSSAAARPDNQRRGSTGCSGCRCRYTASVPCRNSGAAGGGCGSRNASWPS